MSGPGQRADEAVAHAEELLERKNRMSRIFRAAFAVMALLFLALILLAAGRTLYEIHSCVTPGWPCNEESSRRTAEVVVDLNQGHVEITGDLDDIKEMLRQIKKMETQP